MGENANHKDLPSDALDDKQISCPHCHFEFKIDDIAYTLKNGFFNCPVCGKKFPSPSNSDQNSTPPLVPVSRLLPPVFVFLGIIAACTVIYFLTSTDKTVPAPNAVAPVMTPPHKAPSPDQTTNPPVSPATPAFPMAAPAAPDKNASEVARPLPKPPEKMQIIKAIAAKYHASHTYTMDGGFVCLDMAIDVWNQLRTYGIDAKIMGGIITQNITAWNFQKLAFDGNHAWVVATLSPTEKVAIETTEGKVFTPEMENASAYFKGIAFDTPAQIKKFEYYRHKAYETCRETKQLVKDWNENIVGKQHEQDKYEEIIARKSHIGIRSKECENSLSQMKEFESKAIFY